MANKTVLEAIVMRLAIQVDRDVTGVPGASYNPVSVVMEDWDYVNGIPQAKAPTSVKGE